MADKNNTGYMLASLNKLLPTNNTEEGEQLPLDPLNEPLPPSLSMENLLTNCLAKKNKWEYTPKG